MVKNERLYRQPNQFQYYFFDTSKMGRTAGAFKELELQVGYCLVDHLAALLAAELAELLLEVLASGLELLVCFGYSAFLDVGEEDVPGFSVLLELLLLDRVTF